MAVVLNYYFVHRGTHRNPICLCRLIRNPTEFVVESSRKTEYRIYRIIGRIDLLYVYQIVPYSHQYTSYTQALSAISPINDTYRKYISYVYVYMKRFIIRSHKELAHTIMEVGKFKSCGANVQVSHSRPRKSKYTSSKASKQEELMFECLKVQNSLLLGEQSAFCSIQAFN